MHRDSKRAKPLRKRMADKTTIEKLFDAAVARRAILKSSAYGAIALFAGKALVSSSHAQNLQAGWRWCRNCQGMYYGNSGHGVCPAGGPHTDAGSGHYLQQFGEDIAGRQQGGWRWCRECQGLFYARSAHGTCPAGGPHTDAGSGHYASIFGEDRQGQQGGWRWCRNCQGMFYGRSAHGACPAGGQHTDAGSGHYATLMGA
jgi:Zn finger protein HypA/HybF involved in hydrogenase expression